jgi:hypothetical protein
MDHAVTVRAEQGKLANAPGALAANVQGLDVMALDVTLTTFTIELVEIELAYLAVQRPACREHAVDLLPPEGRVSFAVGVPPGFRR